jgi:hypothetical protein
MAMLTVSRRASRLTVETLAARLVWDAAAGGQLVAVTLKEELGEHDLLPAGAVLPDFSVTLNNRRLRLLGSAAELAVTSRAPDLIRFSARSSLAGGALRVTQEYEVHEEGALFCSLIVELASGERRTLNACALDVGLDIRNATKAAWGYFSRQMTYKRDYATVHPYLQAHVRREPAEIADAPELFPHLTLDLGWGNTRFFANHVEFLLEDWTALNDGPWSNTRTRAGLERGLWRLSWRLYEGPAAAWQGPRRYRNRWGLLFGRARNRAGADADPAVRNNALGARICHIKYPYAREGDRWPWVSMPIKQVDQQPPQLFQGNPPPRRADEAADAGASLVILHQFWMANPGTNNEPPADYRALNPAWLRSFVDRCHRRRMRVLLYIRGTEPWLMYAPFFEQFLRRDRDGLYADWNTVFFMGYNKSSPLHLSMHSYFHYGKALRERVGPGGILVGHTSNTNQLTLASYDAALNGETSVRHDELLVNPEMTSYFASLHTVGGHLISGNLPDRKAFSSAKATALCAALGMTSHAAMEPGLKFAACAAYLRPLWNAMAGLPGRVTRLHNPAYIPTRAVATASDSLYPSLWENDAGEALLLVTNMAATPQSGSVELDLRRLDVPRDAVVHPLAIPGTSLQTGADRAGVRLADLPPETFAAFAIRRRR